MSTPPPGPFDGDPPPPPPPPPGGAGPWQSDQLPPHPTAGAIQADLEQPSTIRNAVRLMWVGAGLSLVGVLATFTQTDEIRDQVEESEPSLTSSEVDAAVSVGIAFAVVLGLVVVGLWLWMAYANGKGKKWARVVATVLGALNVISVLISLSGATATGVTVLFSLVSLALAVVILVLLYQPASTRFYEARSRVGW
ncbi:MAG TPA: hypothetical protein VFZ77_01045 [Acidimicrobiales bacterium]